MSISGQFYRGIVTAFPRFGKCKNRKKFNVHFADKPSLWRWTPPRPRKCSPSIAKFVAGPWRSPSIARTGRFWTWMSGVIELWVRVAHRYSLLWRWMRPEVADYLPGPADAYLNMVQFTESGVSIEFLPLHKKSTDGVIRLLFLFATKLVECLHYGAIQIPRPKLRSAVPCRLQIRGTAKSSVLLIRGLDVGERLYVGEIETVAEVNDRTQDSRIFNFAVITLAFCKRPALGS